MISKIIQKEKELQDKLLLIIGYEYGEERRQDHKQSLINLKEYLEGELRFNRKLYEEVEKHLNNFGKIVMSNRTDKLKEDIKELNKMIEAYNV